MKMEEREHRDFRKNPPKSIEEANESIELLREKEEHVKVQIETLVEDDFEVDALYDDWLKRAQYALAMIRTQCSFLQRWVRLSKEGARAAQKALKNQARYSHAHPPESIAVAKERIKELYDLEGEIQTDLVAKGLQDFPDQSAFQGWRNKAQYALTKKRAERIFLETWVRERDPEFLSAADQVVKNFQQKAETIAGEIGDTCKQQYSNQHLPPDLPTAQVRKEVLVTAETRISTAIADLRTECGRHTHITEKQFRSIRRPLNYLLGMARAELKALKEFIRTHKDDIHSIPPVVKEAKASQKRLRAPKGVKPPANTKDAEARIDAIDKVREGLCSAIAVTTMENFQGEGTFQQWRQKTHRLFLQTTIERDYLLRWIREWIPSFVPKKNDELQKIVDAILARTRAVIREMTDCCTQEYSAEQPPSDPHAAQERRKKLGALHTQISERIVEFRTEWYSHPLSRELFNREVHAPLVKIIESIKTEFAVIKRYLGENTRHSITQKNFLAELVTRAIASGVELTSDEKKRFDAIARHVQVKQ